MLKGSAEWKKEINTLSGKKPPNSILELRDLKEKRKRGET